ncbi:MAG: cytochrome c biogenesis protein ResB [Geitlerinemataceae cyanobacterium]
MLNLATQFTRFLGSVKLAVPLMTAIAAILIGATFYESEVGSATVQLQIYKSWWFGLLMFLLAANLGVSTLTRYPWRGARKVGFALTHFGLIVLIAGSAAVIHLSTEGMLLVRTDSAANSQVRVEGDLLEVIAPDGRRQQTDIFVKPDGSVYPPQFAGIELVSYSDNAIKTVEFREGGAVDNRAVRLELSSDRMGQTLERWLAIAPAAYSDLEVGPAQLQLMHADTDAELQGLLSPPVAETHLLGVLQIGAQDIDVEQQSFTPIALPDGVTVTIAQLWPDFRLDRDGLPSSASSEFRNPAVQLEVTQGETSERWFVFAQTGFEPIRSGETIALDPTALSYTPPKQTPSDFFRVVESPDRELFYAALSSKGFKSGSLALGQSVTPGWADFEITLAESLDRARVQRSIVPVTPVAVPGGAPQGSPALHVTLADGTDTWLPWGEPTTVASSAGDYYAAFSPKLLQLPFSVQLDDFIVERNEGSESVAMWTSAVTLTDAHRGDRVQRRVWMNHPTWFEGWKLAQASWNPGDLQQSTLQLKREPWWVTALTWLGSVLVVVGIATMFYAPALLKRFRKARAARSNAVSPGATTASEVSETGETPATEAIPDLAG